MTNVKLHCIFVLSITNNILSTTKTNNMKKFHFRMSNAKDTVIEYFVTGEIADFEKFFQEAIVIASTAKGAWIAYIGITDAPAQIEVK